MKSPEKQYKTIFAGTSDFGLDSFRSLYKSERFHISAVITQPDKKVGRKRLLTPSPIKKEALERNIKVWQPQDISEIEKQIKEEGVDLMVVISYGQIIPKKILDLPKHGCFNVHGSLLPKYRGSAVISAPILNGDKKSGVSIIKMDTGLDTGDILKQKEIILDTQETASSLHKKLAKLGGEIVESCLIDYLKGRIEPKKQDDSRASYVKMLKKQDGHLNWSEEAQKIERRVRALNPWPGTFSRIKDKNSSPRMLKILELDPVILRDSNHPPGTLFLNKNKELVVQSGQGVLKIKSLQPEGKKGMSGKDFLKGYKEMEGRLLE